MSTHPLVVALFDTETAAATAAMALRAVGVPRERVSIIARSPQAGQLADATGATPGSEIEESYRASRLGELGAHLLAAIAVVMPGIGPILADGPLAADLSEVAGHLAGGVGTGLTRAGLAPDRAARWESEIAQGRVLVGAHVAEEHVGRVLEAVTGAGASDMATVAWPGNLP